MEYLPYGKEYRLNLGCASLSGEFTGDHFWGNRFLLLYLYLDFFESIIKIRYITGKLQSFCNFYLVIIFSLQLL